MTKGILEIFVRASEKMEILIGEYPETKSKILRKKGIKGRSDYLSYNKKNFSIPLDHSENEISLADAIKIINEKKKKK